MNIERIKDAIALHHLDIIKQEFDPTQTEENRYAIHGIFETACRFGGPDVIQTLIDCGANFSSGESSSAYIEHILDNCVWHERYNMYNWYRCKVLSTKVVDIIPKADRLASLKLLLEHPEFDIGAGELLYHAIMQQDHEVVELIRSYNITFSEKVYKGIFSSHSYYRYALFDLFEFRKYIYFERFLDIVEDIMKESKGDKIIIPDKILYEDMIVFEPDVVERMIKCFSFSAVNKLRFMKANFKISMFPVYERFGWLNHKVSREAIIEYAIQQNDVEIISWLMDFKNRKVDFEKERKSEERRMQRELSAKPDSVYMLRKIWSYRKCADGDTLEITRYKGDSSDITIPTKIGNRQVTRIGNRAFRSCNKIESLTFPDVITHIGKDAVFGLENLKEVKLSENLKAIDAYAFYCCAKLTSVVIPPNVETVGNSAFLYCKELSCVELSEGLVEIAENAFGKCDKLDEIVIPASVTKIHRTSFLESTTLIVHRDSLAHVFCVSEGRKHKVID